MQIADAPPGLGDLVHVALSSVGITPERVQNWIGTPCGCEARRIKLNMLGNWAMGTIRGRVKDSKKCLENMFLTFTQSR